MSNESSFIDRIRSFLDGLVEKVGAEATVENTIQIEITIGKGEIQSSVQELPDLESLSLPALYELRNETQEKLDEYQEEEPEELDSDEYEEWEDAIETLSEFLDDIDDRIEELEDQE